MWSIMDSIGMVHAKYPVRWNDMNWEELNESLEESSKEKIFPTKRIFPFKRELV